MLEVEAKAHLDDPQAAVRRLIDMGAREVFYSVQRDTYYRHPGRDFAATDEALRIREEEGRAILTYKGPKVDTETKTREELEVTLVDHKAMGTLLLRLGFEPVAVVEKHRRGFRLGELEVDVDEVKGLGHFLEVESKGEGALEEERGRVLGLLRELGLERTERRSYLELLLQRGGPEARSPH
jgi:adenylate cyclase class 2